ncbi:YraN family protein [Candidatus Saccharibacteria bacterium]|nr:YraN family protein [Candidatus Saccharibacteria bacterium]
MTNYAHGHDAEKVAAKHLEALGYTIIMLNWRVRRAEIDIVAQRHPRFRPSGPLVFFEVKYRKTDAQGRGFDYITPRKLEQMRFAAELYVSTEDYQGDYALGAIEVSGTEYRVTGVLDSLT